MPERCNTCDRSDRAGATECLAPGAGLDGFRCPGGSAPRDAAVSRRSADRPARLFQAQIGAVEHGLQNAARRGPAPSALLVDVEIADPFIVAGVEIRRSAGSPSRSAASPTASRTSQDSRGASIAPAAARAVMLAFAEKMILQPPERAAARRPSPSRRGRAGANGRNPAAWPRIEIMALIAERAADHLAARIGQRAAVEPRLRSRSRTSSRNADCRSQRDSRPECGTRSSCRCRRPRESARGFLGRPTAGWP